MIIGKALAIVSRSGCPSIRAFHLSRVLINDSAVVRCDIKCRSVWQRIVHESKHYYRGCQLLASETKIAVRLGHQMLNGYTLTRRERKQVRKESKVLH